MGEVLELLTSRGHALVAWVLAMNAWTGGLLVGALLVDRLLTKRARAAWRVALYAPIAVRIVLPIDWTITLPRAPHAVTLLTPMPEALPPPIMPMHGAPHLTVQALVAIAYATVAFLLAVRWGIAEARLRRALADAAPVTRDLGAPCPVLAHAELGPMLVGTLAPRIVIPTRMLDGDADALACVLRHEAAHLRRRDPLTAALVRLLTIVAWPVVPVWIAARCVRDLLELACDEAALAGADADARRRYGHVLLGVAELRANESLPALHFGRALRARIEALGANRRWPRVAQAGFVAAAAIGFGACSSTTPLTVERSPWTPPPDGPLTDEAIERICAPFADALVPARMPLTYRWSMHSGDGLPLEHSAFCKTDPRVRQFVRAQELRERHASPEYHWVKEARNALGQIAKDLDAAYRRDHVLCPSGAPIPAAMPAPNTRYPVKVEEWDVPGWQCLQFAMDQPIGFQYSLETTADGFVATAHGQELQEGRLIDVTMVARGRVVDGELEVAPQLEETWKPL